VINQARFNFMSEARIGYARDPQQVNLPGECQNTIVLTEEFYREIHTHPIPMDLEASQLGNVAYSRPRKFREKVEQWLDLVRTLWPECPWRISSDGSALIVAPASAILRCGGEYASA
jgi:hypothetical protein